MMNRLRRFRKDEFVRGSILLVIMLGIFNILNYVFQISMARMLSAADYGIIAVLMSFVYIFGIPSEAIQTIVSRYTSKFAIKKENGKIKDLLLKSLRKSLTFSITFFVIFLLLVLFFSSWLRISFFLLAITGLIIITSFFTPITRGILQGKKRFKEMGLNLILEAVIKIVFSVSLVFIGLNVYGAIGGVVLGTAGAFLLSFPFIKEVLKSKVKDGKFKDIYSYNFASLIAITSIVLIYSVDIILARKFFSPELAGQYAFVSLIAKTIVFANIAIGKAMFPLAAEKFEGGKKTGKILKKSILFISLISAVALGLFFFFPEQVIRILSLGSDKYLQASGVLFLLGLAFSLTSFSYILSLYNISINKMKKTASFMLVFALVEIILLCLFNSSLESFAISILISNVLMFIYSVTLYLKK